MRISDWSSDVCASDLPLGEISSLEEFHALSGQLTRFLMEYKFGIDEVTTKISILQEEFAHLHDYNPIEHVLSRVKSPEDRQRVERGKSVTIRLVFGGCRSIKKKKKLSKTTIK